MRLTIRDYCITQGYTPDTATFNRPARTGVSYIQLAGGGTMTFTDSLSNFIDIATDEHGMCVLSSCSMVTSTATTCATSGVTYFTASNSGSTVTVTT